MLYPETREGKVLKRLLEKLERMRERLGDSVYDVIGNLLEGVRLEELIMQALLRQDTEEVERVIDVDVEKRLEVYRRALEESALAGHHIDLSSVLPNGSRFTCAAKRSAASEACRLDVLVSLPHFLEGTVLLQS